MHFVLLGLCVLVHSFKQVDVTHQRQLRNVINDPNKLWERNFMVYQISSLFDDAQKSVIEESMREIEHDVSTDNGNCITFQKKEGAYRDRTDYVFITQAPNGLCKTDHVGMASGRQKLYLTDNCMYKRNIMSLLLVTLGLYHEHQRPDRDQYIQVHMDNVQNAAESLFNKTLAEDTDLLGLPYDFHSITHFGQYEYAKNTSLPTITTNVSGVSFGDRDILSFYDVFKVQTLYKCAKGYTMIGHGINHFTQTSDQCYFPQWRLSSEDLPGYMNTSCDVKGPYALTVLNGATWISRFPLPSGDFCVSVSVCIATSSHDIKSYIKMDGLDVCQLNYTQPSGQWKTFKRTYTSEQEWTMLLKAYIMWGGDVLALNDVTVTSGLCEMMEKPNLQ